MQSRQIGASTKKLFILTTIILSIITLIGCSSKKSTENQNSTQDQTEITEETIDYDDESQNTVEAIDQNQTIPRQTQDLPIIYESVTGDNLTVGVEFTKDLLDENFDKLLKAYQYDDKMKTAMAMDDTKKTIVFYNAEYGQLEKINEAYTYVLGAYQYVEVPVEGAINNFNLKLCFDGNKNIVGFTYEEYTENDTAKEKTIPEGVIETEYSFTNDGFVLPGTLTTPKEGTDYPVVIFVHGSGASDRDETIYQNKPFRDIAWALAEQGIASYRYDKRSYLYSQQMLEDVTFTIDDEIISDAVAAARMVSELENMNSSEVYMLGHSLGGYVIPRIAKQYTEAAGFIMMAAPAKHMKEYILEQYEYISNEDGVVTNEEQKNINIIKEQIAMLDTPEDIPDNELILGAYRDYWIDLDQYDAVKTAKKISAPILVLQGKRDYQVTPDQFDLWKKTFKDYKNWTFKTYSTLNHLMMSGEGKSSPTEYEVESSVDSKVIQDIIDFVK